MALRELSLETVVERLGTLGLVVLVELQFARLVVIDDEECLHALIPSTSSSTDRNPLSEGAMSE